MLVCGAGGELLIVSIEEPPNFNDGTRFLNEVPSVDAGDALRRLQNRADRKCAGPKPSAQRPSYRSDSRNG